MLKRTLFNVLWPQYEALNKALTEYLSETTVKIISEEVHRDTTEAQEIIQLLETG
ncbi:MAG: hypothetical protein KBD90_01765 [Alphaproteobacteria bacterium]|nr:hypothetical protein [Alphaproteobacteria bacterium]